MGLRDHLLDPGAAHGRFDEWVTDRAVTPERVRRFVADPGGSATMAMNIMPYLRRPALDIDRLSRKIGFVET